MEHLRKELESVLGEGQVLQNEPLGRHTTFRVGGSADLFVSPDILQLPKVMEIVSAYNVPVTVIGNGSNLLVGDRGIRGVVIEIGRRMGAISVDGESVTAQAGALLSRVAGEAYKNGLSGLEFAAGIPGSTGGAMVMNAGAYGGEMKDVTVRVKALSGDGNILNLDAAQMDFSYRHSCVAERGYLVLEAVFLLQKADPERILSRMEELKEQRVSKQPLEYPSAGSTFKRPQGYFAGKLIMDAGLAGFTIGGAQVSPKHCGFVINRGNAKAADVLAVIRHVQKTVRAQFGVELEPEVRMLGEF
ncbi:MAG: UDP-N-acetylmuramate dehydrogenase [Eubacterium sp.]|nr:UDP-N-acetylmuramate dehydrogenase [Eubacterium sp.]